MEYGYVNARIKGMKSRLLTTHDLDELTNKPDLDAFISSLEETAYREELQKAGIESAGLERIEVALRRDLIRAFQKVLSLFAGEREEVYIRIILNRWDIQNIKTLLRGKKINAPTNEIRDCLLPAGELDMAALLELSKQPDVRAIIDLLATWRIDYSRPLTRNLPAYLDTRDLAVLELPLDRYYYERALSLLDNPEHYDQQIILDMITTEIDITNIRTLLRITREKMQDETIRDYLIDGGRYLSIERLESLASSGSIPDILVELGTTPYGFLGGIQPECISAGRISVIERELERFMIEKGCKNFLREPLSIAIPVAYIWAKQNEVINLRIIAHSIIGDVPESELRRALSYV
ncbi:V/A-type H+-transporting ATPase subunit C [Methanocalculus alkaliphilus]|uniref:ATP synthase A1 subunit C n=1 Tax=Methanocalculus alkaliphilus TaxID=768730 RepID=UPI00209D3E05|nr:ATP synthase A1 subunit C [Methanocalculus alkaliphilus]MCP1714644.1 V/A-type H+-transporting ATPase subunit C [Methanocalculus alkaliphilus]